MSTTEESSNHTESGVGHFERNSEKSSKSCRNMIIEETKQEVLNEDEPRGSGK